MTAGEPASLLRDLAANMRTHPAMPPGAFAVRSGGLQAVWASDATRVLGESVISDLIAEDCRSVMESADYIVRYGGLGPSITCECCGTDVAGMPEALVAQDRPRTWKRGIWEHETLRRHTLRRCEWKRANP